MAATHQAKYPLAVWQRTRPGDSVAFGNIPLILQFKLLEKTMWSKPEYTEMRFGFEVTMYIANR
jgi:coenzyme PQQ precursor peptide PqqA